MSSKIMDRILNSPSLPSMPIVAIKVLELTQKEDVSTNEIADVIQKDPALTAKLLQTANSSLFGLPKKVGSIQQATVRVLEADAHVVFRLGLEPEKAADKVGGLHTRERKAGTVLLLAGFAVFYPGLGVFVRVVRRSAFDDNPYSVKVPVEFDLWPCL